MISISNAIFQFPMVASDIQYRYEFKTDFEPTIKGSEGRVVRWGEYRLSLTFPEMPLTEEEIETLKAFHAARNGKTEGFLVKVPDNYILSSSQGKLLPLNDVDTLFQIIRIHAIGTVETHKPIRYLISNTLKVFVNGVEAVTGWTVNINTGKILFAEPQTGNLTVSCEFYTPMRFDNDTIEGIQVSGGEDDVFRFIQNPSNALKILRGIVKLNPIFQVSGLVLKEVHLPIETTFYNLADFNPITTDFNYPIVPQNVQTIEKRVEIEDSIAGIESTKLRDTRTITRYLSTALRNDEIDYLLNYFLVAKGRAIAFNGKRFNKDDFSYTRVSPDYSIISDIEVISCPDGNRRYHVFGRYLDKHIDNCNKIAYWRTTTPIVLTPFENTSVIEVTRSNLENTPNIASNLIVKKNYQPNSQAIQLWSLGGAGFSAGSYIDYEKKSLIPENVTGGFFGIYIDYRAQSLNCNGLNETPSFPRGDNPEITDIVEITNNAVGGALPFATILKITLATCSGTGESEFILLDFEGLQNLEQVLNFYNGGTGSLGSSGTNYGVSFSNNTYASDQNSPLSNTAGLPSPVISITFLGTNETESIMNVAGGFNTGFSFFYSAPFLLFPAFVEIYDELDGTGTLLATLNLPTTPDSSTDPACSPGDYFCPFVFTGVSFTGTARSVKFIGTANLVAFDNITLGNQTQTPTPPIKAYTSWDSDLTIDGILYRSNPGIIPTAVSSKSDISADNLEVSTFFDDITEIDILSGKYEKAKVEAWVINIADLEKPPISLFGGEIGDITSGDNRFTFALRSKSTQLNQAISVKTSDQCFYNFCDSRCGLDIEDYTETGFEVTEIKLSKYAQRAFTVTPNPSQSLYTNGYLTFTSGQLKCVRLDIKRIISGGEIQLWSNLPLGLAVGDTLNLSRGCGKTPTDCQEYSNYVNFGGFPIDGNWMVGDDALLAGD
jgi:uncharacterized phage protein (TIGR02218 family)/uncharacterized protein (TIGR02217 family)